MACETKWITYDVHISYTGSCWPCYVFIAAAVLAVVAVLYVNNGIPGKS